MSGPDTRSLEDCPEITSEDDQGNWYDPSLSLPDGFFFTRDIDQLCELVGAEALQVWEGTTWAYIPTRGMVQLSELMKAMKPPATVTAINTGKGNDRSSS